MSSIEEKRQARTAFMNRLYDAADGSERFYENYQVIGTPLGLTIGLTHMTWLSIW